MSVSATILASSERTCIRELLDLHSEVEVAGLLGVSRQTLGRAVAGFALRRGTVVLIRQRLAECTAP